MRLLFTVAQPIVGHFSAIATVIRVFGGVLCAFVAEPIGCVIAAGLTLSQGFSAVAKKAEKNSTTQDDSARKRWRTKLSPGTIRNLVANFSHQLETSTILRKAVEGVFSTICHRKIPAGLTRREPNVMQDRICTVLAELDQSGRLRDSMQAYEVRDLVRPIYLRKYGAEAIMPSARTIGRAHHKYLVEHPPR